MDREPALFLILKMHRLNRQGIKHVNKSFFQFPRRYCRMDQYCDVRLFWSPIHKRFHSCRGFLTFFSKSYPHKSQ